MTPFSQLSDDSRGVAPVTAVALGVVVALVLALVVITGVVSLAENTDQDEVPPQTVLDIEQQPSGLLTIVHEGGEAVGTENLSVIGPDTEHNGFGDRTLTAGDRIEIPVEGSGTASVVWKNGDTSTTIQQFQAPGMGNWTELQTKLKNNEDITLQRDYTPNSPGYDNLFGSSNWDGISSYDGTFDGNGHEIRNVTVDGSGSRTGFIGYLGVDSEVKNLNIKNLNVSGADRTGFIGLADGDVRNVHLENVDIEGKGRVGALVGQNQYEVVAGSSVNGGTVTGDGGVGGLVGSNQGATRGSSANVTVEADAVAGGLVGNNRASITGDIGEIADSFATGDVVSTGDYAGGLAGRNEHYINNSYATGNVTGQDWTGGLVGEQSAWRPHEEAVIRDSYATGIVSGNKNVGALVGEMGAGIGIYPGIIRDSSATSPVSGTSNVGELVGLLSTGAVDNSAYRP